MAARIYLEALQPIVDGTHVRLTIDSYVCLFVHRYLSAPADLLRVCFVQPSVPSTGSVVASRAFLVNVAGLDFECIEFVAFSERLASLCDFPVLETVASSVVVAGLCAVCRHMVKSCGASRAELLGFKGGCLLAPSEQSVWTRFCELDVVSAVHQLQSALKAASSVKLPTEFGRFELHMSQPVRMHNIYKVAREQEKLEKPKKTERITDLVDKLHSICLTGDQRRPKHPERISSSVPMDQLNIAHTFAEGQQLTLADLMLFACFGLAYDQLLTADHCVQLRVELPRFVAWLDTVRQQLNGVPLMPARLDELPAHTGPLRIDQTDTRSLYKNDSKRYKPRSQIFTKQADIDAVLDKVRSLRLAISSDTAGRFADKDFAWWQTLPFDALPEGGALPADRLLRKQHQLQSLAVEVLRLAAPGARIVDFCSGAGHLGIVVAALRPDCEVILLENKDQSLQRARDRVERLRLKNVRFFQCNLDYFSGPFDVGASLHACGVATDIVLEQCIRARAAFVCCPCCYGGCREMPHIRYPRSALFGGSGLTMQDCMHVAHCADQAHNVRCNEEKATQGAHCMDVMDWDRKLCAEERGYEVVLTRLQPEDCTTKNRLLVGRLVAGNRAHEQGLTKV